jgi:signal transduction histidine kinase
MAEYRGVAEHRAVVAESSKTGAAFFMDTAALLRRYLNAITGFSDVLSLERLPDDHRQYVFDINEAAHKASLLLSDVVRLFEIESGELKPSNNSFCPDMLLSEICAIIQPQAAKKGLEFAFVHAGDIPARICCDRRLLLECLLNLADHALATTNDGYIHINISTERDVVGAVIRFDFADCHSKMVATAKEKASASCGSECMEFKNPFETNGLKLAIATRLAEKLGGQILASDNPDCLWVLSLIVPLGRDI